MAVVDPQEMRRRINAARELTAPTPAELKARKPKYDDAGYGISVEELAARIPDHAQLGARTLGKIRRGERAARPQDLRFIAEACDLPEEFFSADLHSIAQTGSDLERRLGRIERAFSQLAALGLAGLDQDEEATLQQRARSETQSARAARGSKRKGGA